VRRTRPPPAPVGAAHLFHQRRDTLPDARDARRVRQITAGDLDQTAEQRCPSEQIMERLQPALQFRIAIGEGSKI